MSLNLVGGVLGQNALQLILQTGAFAKAVLAILLFFSVVSWAIIIDKFLAFRRLRRESDNFLKVFRMKGNSPETYQASRGHPHSPFGQVFKEGYRELAELAENPGSRSVYGNAPQITGEKVRELPRILAAVAGRELGKLEKHLTFLATTGSVSPFFGLLGTVWGIMGAFAAIGYRGSADLATVAPGIAEALVTTVAGLGAAIPAIMAYNHFVGRLRKLETELEHFSTEFIRMALRGIPNEVE